MSTVLYSWLTTAQTASRPRNPFGLCSRCTYRLYSRLHIKSEIFGQSASGQSFMLTPTIADDSVLLKQMGNDEAKPILVNRVRSLGKIVTHRGSIDQASLIGREIRDVVYTSKGVAYRILQPSLADYVTLSPRIVTPIYPMDASLIVSLLDIHPPIHSEDNVLNEPFEIFEAGTGHGALTLHLARAIHGLNPPPPPLPPKHLFDKSLPDKPVIQVSDGPKSGQDSPPTGESSTVETKLETGDVPDYDQDTQSTNKFAPALEHKSVEEARFEAYLPSRRAVIRTLDISPVISKYAQNIVRRFRRGLYYHNIDFHVSPIPKYLSSRLVTAPGPFLEHAILDLPNPQEHLEIVSQALKPNGSLIVFCPSITQIADCVKLIEAKRLPLHRESILELGAGIGVGGRAWDVRLVRPRAILKAEAEAGIMREDSKTVSDLVPADEQAASQLNMSKDPGWAMVCRPKVGGVVAGGGFLGLWRRMARDPPPRVPRTQHGRDLGTEFVGEPEGEK